MNLLQLSKRVGNSFRLRPQPHRLDANGVHLPPTDDQWRLEAIRDNPTGLELHNPGTGHVLELQPDNVKENEALTF